MSPIRENFINIIETLPYDIDEEILKKNTKEIQFRKKNTCNPIDPGLYSILLWHDSYEA